MFFLALCNTVGFSQVPEVPRPECERNEINKIRAPDSGIDIPESQPVPSTTLARRELIEACIAYVYHHKAFHPKCPCPLN